MSGYSWGGSEELWSGAAWQLHSDGHMVAGSVFRWPQLARKVAEMKEKGIEIFQRKFPPATLAARAFNKATFGVQQGYPWLKNRRPDLVIISQGGNKDGLDWMKFCGRRGIPFVAIVQCNTAEWWPLDRKAEEMTTAYHAARKVFCVSRHNLKLLEHQTGGALPTGAVAWNPYNVSSQHQPAWPSTSDKYKLACVARLDPGAKGQDLLFEVLAQPKWRERAIEVNLYGAGPFEQGLRKLAKHFQLNNVFFRGHVAEVEKIWETNHLLVLPSRFEGLPLALVESMWCGRPSLVTDVGGNTELCLEGETGFVAAAPSVACLGDALERAWQRRDDWVKLGQSARRYAEQNIPLDPIGQFCQQLTDLIA